jgi:hypothetical protein
MGRFKLIGTDEQIGNLFSICLTIGNTHYPYESLFISSWPLAGNRKYGMCIAVNEKVRCAISAIRAAAKGCGVELSELTEQEEKRCHEIQRLSVEVENLKRGRNADDMTRAFCRVIDYECYGLLSWMQLCVASKDTATWGKYQSAYNHLVNLREHITSPGWSLQFLDRSKFDMPEAKERIFK